MNTKSSKDIAGIKSKFQSLFTEKSEEEGIKHDAYILMAAYLSEIERIQKDKKLSRKDLAAQIKTSASYLTQVFRGDKPLNFYTLAKIQRVLKVKFQVNALLADQKILSIRADKSKITPVVYIPLSHFKGGKYPASKSNLGA